MKYSFPGQSALVTGAASGIGEATARLLAANGASVVVSDLQADAVQRVVDAIVADGGKAVANVCDVADAAQVEAAVACAVTHFGALHLAVNNAGIGGDSGPAGELSLEAWQRLIDVNLSGVAYGLRYQIPAILAAGGGAIVNMLADMWGGMPGMGHSGAARAGMENFTKTAAYEWGHAGVRVNAVAPGWIASSGMDTYPESMKNMIRNLKDHVPLQRIGSESEVASAIVFLLSPGANFISGNTIRIDGAASQGTRAWTLGKARNSEPYNGFHRAYLPDVLKDQE